MSGSASSPDDAWLDFGVITRPHGVRGELRLRPDAEGLELPGTRRVRLVPRNAEPRELTLASARVVHEGFLVSFEGYLDRDLARTLCGAKLQVPRGEVRGAGEGEAYVFELVGAAVEDLEGNALGTVGAVLGNVGQDLLRIDTPRGERLLPMVDETMRGFDRARRVLRVQIIPGLWDED